MTDGENSGEPSHPPLAGVVLAAGAGARLWPLTRERAKALCPVGNRLLVDLAIERVRSVVGAVAVNVHHHRLQVEEHLARHHRDVTVSVEEPTALGTAGALGELRGWLDGRGALVTNSDAWLPVAPGEVASFVAGWDGERSRLWCVTDPARGDFGDHRYIGVALVPWSVIRGLAARPSGLYEASWRHEEVAGRLDLVTHRGPFTDCGTPRDYLTANLASEGATAQGVIAPGARVEGEVVRSVVWPGARVWPAERLVDAIRTPAQTVLIRP
ncbi:MAG TPA: sugar phosphate nucleotidyltransferase [Acidimicrobiales bacterium]|jgi:NDP-sugar pyrophosphorylase family protein|nr:sugar phosphate nucleotidyltransferase [Acidimicrobiales bacterium]